MSVHAAHLAALGQAELVLFFRSKANLVNVLFVPAMIVLAMTVIIDQYELSDYGLTMGPVMLAIAASITLIMALYVPLTSVYVLRREDLVLKRLRTGEIADTTILLGPALPMAAVAAVQFVVIAAVVSVLADAGLPSAPHLAVLGVVLGAVMMVALAAATQAAARTAENAQVVILPGMFLLPLTSGTFIPLEILPSVMQDVLRFFPLTPVVDLVRSAWSAEMSLSETGVRLLTLLVWTGLAVYAAKRWFRWDPRSTSS